jgi:GTP-binding protein HflX
LVPDLPILEVYNKLDLLEGVEPQIQRDADGKPQRVWLSARDGTGLELLEQAIAELLGSDLFIGTLRCRNDRRCAQFFELGAVKKNTTKKASVCWPFVCPGRVESTGKPRRIAADGIHRATHFAIKA